MDDRALRHQALNLHTAFSHLNLELVPSVAQCEQLMAAALGAVHGLHDLPHLIATRPGNWAWDLGRAAHRVEVRLQTLKRPDGARGLDVSRPQLTSALASAWTLTHHQTRDVLADMVPPGQRAAFRNALGQVTGAITVRLHPDYLKIQRYQGKDVFYEDLTPITRDHIEGVKRRISKLEVNSPDTTGVAGTLSRIQYQGYGIHTSVFLDDPVRLDPKAQHGSWSTLMIVGEEDDPRHSYTRALIRAHIQQGLRVALHGFERWIAGSTPGVPAISPYLLRYYDEGFDMEPGTLQRLLRDRPDVLYWIQPSTQGHDLPQVEALVRAGIRVVLDTREWEPSAYLGYAGWAADVTIQR